MSVEHDESHQRFVMRVGRYEACLMYARKGDALDFYHVYVPEPYRNRGLVGWVLLAGFDYALEHGLKVVPTCPFIAQDFLPRFPRYQPLIQQGSFPFVDAV